MLTVGVASRGDLLDDFVAGHRPSEVIGKPLMLLRRAALISTSLPLRIAASHSINQSSNQNT